MHQESAAGHLGETETTTGLDNRKLLMWTFLGSETLFFGSLIATYLVYAGRSLVGPYPGEVLDIPTTSVSTFVLLTSSLGMVQALAALQRGNHRGTQVWLLATALLGATFLGFQFFEFTEFVREGLTLQVNLFGSTFFTLTGFHGAHVTVGVFMLLSLFVLSVMGRLPQSSSLNVEMVGLYWHFVDIVWIIIFTVVYLIGVGT